MSDATHSLVILVSVEGVRVNGDSQGWLASNVYIYATHSQNMRQRVRAV